MFIEAAKIGAVHNWKDYGRLIRSQGIDLLQNLDDYPNSILVTGCQRSGTTMTTEVINQSSELTQYSYGRESSLDAALMLYGYIEHVPHGRYCFQTTWLNNRYPEYFKYRNGHRIVWVLRNPFSVVRSMLYNWPVGALDELFQECGTSVLTGNRKWLYRLLSLGPISAAQQAYFGYKGKGAKYLLRERYHHDQLMTLDFSEPRVMRAVDKLHRACFAYNGKVSQLFALKARIDQEHLMVVEYDELVQNKETLLRQIFEFVDLKYEPVYAEMIHSQSLKKSETLSAHEMAAIQEICLPTYTQARELVSI